jgi:hypothetical protein
LLPHLISNSPELKLILIIRNPLAVMNSWMNSPREFNPQWNPLTEWRKAELKNQNKSENYFGFDKWKEAALLFEDLYLQFPNRVRIVKYDDLLSNPSESVKSLFEFSGLGFTTSTENFIIKSRESEHVDDPNSVFRKKGKIDDGFKGRVPNEVIEGICEDLKGTKLEKYLTLL